MSHGEGFRGQVSGTTSPDSPLNEFHPTGSQRPEFGDGSPLSSSSRFSSCEESEFERYCSANSALGTPSLCSSVGAFHGFVVDCDSGSTRCLAPMDGDFSLGGRFSRKLEDDKGHSLLDPIENVDGLCENAESSWVGLESTTVERFSGNVENLATVGAKVERDDLGMLLSNVENVLKQRSISAKTMGDKISNELVVYGGGSGGNFNLSSSMEFEEQEQEDSSSRQEHSDGEDSVFNCGSDNESRHDVYYTRNEHSHYGKEAEKGNMILMNSSIAFGSADWEDFELETVENAPSFQVLNPHREKEALNCGTNINPPTVASVVPLGHRAVHGQDHNRYTSDVPQVGDQVQDVSELTNPTSCTLVTRVEPSKFRKPQHRGAVKDSSSFSEKFHTDDDTIEYLEGCQVYNIFEKTDPLLQRTTLVLCSTDSVEDKEHQHGAANQNSGHGVQLVYQEKSESPSDIMFGQTSPAKDIFEDPPTKNVFEDEMLEVPLVYKSTILSDGTEGDVGRIPDQSDSTEAKVVPSKGKTIELNAFYDEVVHDMEEILLDSSEPPMTRLNQSNKMFHSQQPLPLRDGGSTASTSGTDDTCPLNYPFLRIDGVEVVGAKQKRGDISLSERLVGVKEHTVYAIHVQGGQDQWEVERRYRDFYTLYHQLKSLFSDRGWILPSPWSAVEWESKKIFGNSSPDVIVQRSALIQECLLSVVKFRYPSGPPSPLIWFLSPPKALSSSPQSNVAVNQSDTGSDFENISSLGKTISLIVETRPHKSIKQMLEAQHYTCEGCHKHFDGGRMRVLELVQTFGWGKPRLCEYTGQLFCSSCHTNDGAVLPFRVLHYWDFTEYPVSQLAKSYLDSIIDQPMLCVSAVNPFLFSKVKVLLHVVGIRKKIEALLHYVRCPFRGSIYIKLGSRRYLLESNDFFALRDLIDLSRGAFAVLPVILETVLKKIQEHITDQCLVCCDIGVPCGARQACDDTSSLIFPFQDEEEIRRCETCNLVFHKQCFVRLVECPCGARLTADEATQSTSGLSLGANHDGTDGVLSLFRGKSDLGLRSSMGMGFLSNLFPVGRQEKTRRQQEGNNVILMGSLPGDSL